jgi:hypothetical protein
MPKLPASLRQRSNIDAIREDVLPYLGMTQEQRAEATSELCRWARDAIEASPDPVAAWRSEDPRSPESLALWQRLVRQARRRY